jgi:hypothetical protein
LSRTSATMMMSGNKPERRMKTNSDIDPPACASRQRHLAAGG